MYFFDTTYFLPFAGIATKITGLRDQLKSVVNNANIPLSLSQVTFLELKWLSFREYRSNSNHEILQRCNSAIQSIMYNQYLTVFNPWKSTEILSLADTVRMAGHKDYMDCLILASAKFHNQKLVSEDEKFTELIDKLDWNLELMNWSNFMKERN